MTRYGKKILLIQALVCFPIFKPECLPAQTNGMEDIVLAYDSLFTASMEEERIPGAAVVIAADNRIVFMKAYGVRSLKTKKPVTVNTVFRLASVSKGFAGVLACTLKEKGILEWDKPIVSSLPDFRLSDPDHAQKITLRHLLSHSTGLLQHAYTDLLEANIPYARLVSELKTVPIGGPPGDYYGYQNVVFSLIGNVIEKETGKPYGDWLGEIIFDPLGMKHASLGYEAMLGDTNRADPHLKDKRTQGSWFASTLSRSFYSVLPAAGVNASISDMGQWLLALLGNNPEFIPLQVIDEVSLPLIRTENQRKYFREWKKLGTIYYGLGWRIFHRKGLELVYHGGYVRGYRAEIAFDRENRVGIAVLMNASAQLANVCVPRFFDIYQKQKAGLNRP